MSDETTEESDARTGAKGYSFLRRNRDESPAESGTGTVPDDGSGSGGRDRQSAGSGPTGGATLGNGTQGNVSGNSGISGDDTERIREDKSDTRETDESGGRGSESGGFGSGGIRSGRHRVACSCQRCRNRRSERGEPEPTEYTDDGTETGASETRAPKSRQTAIPRSVEWDSIFPGIEQGSKVKIDDILAYAFVVIYKFPVLMGYGEHWELSKEEAKQLGSTLKTCLESLPQERKARIMKRAENILPWFALIGFAGIMTYGRILLTREMQAKQGRFPKYVAPPETTNEREPNVDGQVEAFARRENQRVPGAEYSGGHSMPLPFIVPE